jgi:muramoyltetrapeptide carboxypeptidase
MIKPNRLKKGDTIGIVASSDALTSERQVEIDSSINFLEGLGFKVKISELVFNNELGYGARAENKAREINKMFADKEINAVFCATGGNNVNGTFDYLDFDIIKNNPKILCGYSDPTSLINVVYLKTGLVTFSGPNFVSLAEEIKGEADYTRKQMIKRFIEADNKLCTENDEFITIKQGKAEGILVGGNLSLITPFSSGKYKIDFTDKILFIEELSYETPPAGVSHYLYNMMQEGVFDKINGLWIGNYNNEITLEQIVLDTLGDKYAFPIIKSNNFGHINTKTTIPIGVKAKIDTQEREKIKLLENCLK